MSKPPPPPLQFKIKQRKRNEVVKYEPEAFRDALHAILPETNNTDTEKYCIALELNEAKLDLKRYAEPFFEIFIVGGLIMPGGVVSIKEKNKFSIFEATENIEDIKLRVAILIKLARRLKYFPKKLEETVASLLNYINKFGENTRKLAIACALFASSGLVSLAILENIIKDHLIVDGSSLAFITLLFQTYLKEQDIDHLTLALRKADIDWRLMEFFPLKQRHQQDFEAHLIDNKLDGILEYYKRQQSLAIKDQASEILGKMFTTSSAEQIISYLQQEVDENGWAEHEMPPILWDSMLTSGDYSSRIDQIESNLVKMIERWASVFIPFTTTPKSELGLILRIQTFTYDDNKFLKHFRVIVQTLYKFDVLGESAIIYWFEKGASIHGKKVLLKQMEAFVAWLQEDDSDESD